MSKESEPGVNTQVSGSLKEAIGKITGDTDIQAEGSAEKKSGQARREEADASEKKR